MLAIGARCDGSHPCILAGIIRARSLHDAESWRIAVLLWASVTGPAVTTAWPTARMPEIPRSRVRCRLAAGWARLHRGYREITYAFGLTRPATVSAAWRGFPPRSIAATLTFMATTRGDRLCRPPRDRRLRQMHLILVLSHRRDLRRRDRDLN